MTHSQRPDASAFLRHPLARSRPEIEARQLRRVARQVEKLYATNRFYRAKLDAARVTPDQIRTLDDFRKRIPVSTKADFLADQLENHPYGHRLGIPEEKVALVNLTGGTSGQGQEIYGRTHRDIAYLGYLHHMPWFMAGLRAGHVAVNCVPAGGLTTGGWGPAEGIRLANATGLHVGGTLSTESKIDLMLRFGKIHFIYASTNYHQTLTSAFRRRGIRPAEQFPMLESLYTAAEGYSVEWAQRMEDFWGARLHEGYGSTQGVGVIATTCELGALHPDGSRGRMHILEYGNYIEIIDPDTGDPAQPGADGEVIVTNLGVEGSPVLRFSSRDRVRYLPHHECRCGRPWNCIEAGSVGRYDDMMKIRGNNVWPLTIDNIVFSYAEVDEYRGRVFTNDEDDTGVELNIALRAGVEHVAGMPASVFCAVVAERVKRATNVRMDVALVDRAALPEFSYKARRWLDERRKS